LALACLLAACHDGDYLSYEWDDSRILCSFSIDDITNGSQMGRLAEQIQLARDNRRVVLAHAHRPGISISRGMIEEMLDRVDAAGLDYVEYNELVPGPRRAAIAFAFDDNSVDLWLGVRDLLQAHHARVTFFITRYERMTDEEHAGLLTLAADGHDLEPHSVSHIHAESYVQQYDLDAYVQDEVLPSFYVLDALGFTPTTYAYPFGEHTAAMDDAILPHVDKLRVGPETCPR
jgi:hypothetical protein